MFDFRPSYHVWILHFSFLFYYHCNIEQLCLDRLGRKKNWSLAQLSDCFAVFHWLSTENSLAELPGFASTVIPMLLFGVHEYVFLTDVQDVLLFQALNSKILNPGVLYTCQIYFSRFFSRCYIGLHLCAHSQPHEKEGFSKVIWHFSALWETKKPVMQLPAKRKNSREF